MSDFPFLVFGLLFHGAVVFGMSRMTSPGERAPTVVEMDVKAPPPPLEPSPPTKPQPEPVRKAVPRRQSAPRLAATPPANANPPKAPPNEPRRPIFGVTMDSTVPGDSTMAVPVGDTTMIDPSKSGPHTGRSVPLPAASPSTEKRAFHPVSAIYVKTMPDIDSDACGRQIRYPQEAAQLGLEGDVKLQVALDETGRVHDIRVLAPLGHGLDEAAVFALKNKCKFSPAIATDGKAVAFVIPSYTFHFELPR